MTSIDQTETTYIKATFWRRLIAYVLDAIPFFILRVPAIYFLEMDPIVMEIVSGALFMFYYILMEYFWQATLGKMTLDLKVINKDHQPLRLWQVIIRNLGKYISALPLGYGFFRILAPHRLQTIHDELARCLVVRVITQNNRKQ
jgi:uncharacterized RDD family membrane protein YckC